MTANIPQPELAASTPERRFHTRRNLLSGVLFGIAVAAFVDETVFHQLLRWHHFYDRSTTDAGLISDGIFHAVGAFAGVAGLFLLADLHRRHAVWWARWWGGVLLGAGAFEVYDGTIQHKLLGLHQIRYEVDLLPYDLIWNAAGSTLIVAGLVLIVSTRRRAAASRG